MDQVQRRITMCIDRTHKRLCELDARLQDPREKRIRASVNMCLLLQELAATYVSEDAQAEINQLVMLYQNLEQQESRSV